MKIPKAVLGGFLATAMIGGYVAFKRRVVLPESSARFFSDNPHLKPKSYPERELPGYRDAKSTPGPYDFRFKEGESLQIRYRAALEGVSAKPNSDQPSNFGLLLDPGNLNQGYYRIAVTPSGLGTRFHDSLVLTVSPNGGIKSIHLKRPDQPADRPGLEAILKVLFTAFMPRPGIESGSRTVKVEPFVGRVFEMQAQALKSGADEQVWRLSRSESFLEQEITAVWDKSAGRPKSLEVRSSATVPKPGGASAVIKTLENLLWSASAKKGDLADLSKEFPFELDLARFRRGMKIGLQQASSKNPSDFTPQNWEELLRKIKMAHPAEGVPKNLVRAAEEEAFMQMTEALELRPDLVTEAIAELRKSSEPRMRDGLLGALGYQGSPEAQKAMLDFYHSGATEGERKKILSAWAIGTTPLIPEVKNELIRTARGADREVSNPATLALGAAISRDGDPAVIELFKTAYNANTPVFGSGEEAERANRQVIVAGMGNARSTVFLPEITRALNDPDPVVRAEAVHSMRFIPTDDALQVMIKALKNTSESPLVRTSSASGLKYRITRSGVIESLMNAGRSDPENQVRAACVDTLLGVSQNPEVTAFLRERASSDPDPSIRENLKTGGW